LQWNICKTKKPLFTLNTVHGGHWFMAPTSGDWFLQFVLSNVANCAPINLQCDSIFAQDVTHPQTM